MSDTARYSLPAIFLHWVQAFLILWLLWLGWTMIDLPKGAERSAAYGLHKSLGLLALLLVVVRLAWRRRNPPPPLVMSPGEVRLVAVVHGLLYFFMVAAPLAGYLASAYTPYAVKFFGLELPRLAAPDEALNTAFKLFHKGAVWIGAGIIGLHVVGALRHGLGPNGVLGRMLPFFVSNR